MSAAQIGRIRIVGNWQPSQEGMIKGLEDGSDVGIVTVKVMPRQYETPTIPDGSMQVEVTLVMRSDADPTGQSYLTVTDVVQSVMHEWQKCFEKYQSDFAIEGKFVPTGIRLDGGDCGLDKENAIWTFAQSFTAFGIII